LVRITSEVEAVHVPLEIVHLSVAVLPAVTVTVVVGLVGVAIVAVPLTNVHKPVPTVGVLAAIVKAATLQFAWAGPASATVGVAKFVNTTSSDVTQVPFVMVHLRVAVLPAATVTAEVGLVGVVIVAVPETIVHKPVPGVGALPARVKAAMLQLF
jgi:hypothetical protein